MRAIFLAAATSLALCGAAVAAQCTNADAYEKSFNLTAKELFSRLSKEGIRTNADAECFTEKDGVCGFRYPAAKRDTVLTDAWLSICAGKVHEVEIGIPPKMIRETQDFMERMMAAVNAPAHDFVNLEKYLNRDDPNQKFYFIYARPTAYSDNARPPKIVLIIKRVPPNGR